MFVGASDDVCTHVETERTGLTTRRCFIHVGTHKTGTTSIQAFLRDNTQRLAEHGVLVPRAGRGEDAAGHHNLTQELLAAPGYVHERGGLEALGAELRQTALDVACISCEDFTLVSRSTPALALLRDTVAAAGFVPAIVIYLRPQIPYCISIYAEIVKNGYRKPFSTYLTEVLTHHTFVLNGALGPICSYDELLGRFVDVFGARRVHVHRYYGGSPMRALLVSFARILLGPQRTLRDFVFPPERFNPSLSFGGVLGALGSTHQPPDLRFAPLSIRQAVTLAAAFLPGNVRVAREFGVWVPPLELADVVRALPLRRTVARTRALLAGRQALEHLPAILHHRTDRASPSGAHNSGSTENGAPSG